MTKIFGGINWHNTGFICIYFAPFARLAHDQSYTAAYTELLEDLRGNM